MEKFLRIMMVLGLLFCMLSTPSNAQCTGGTSAGAITPNTTWQTLCVQGGQYLTFTAVQGRTYMFSFCQGGGSASWDTQITIINNATGVAVPGAYNDDNCGTGSELSFIAPSAITYRVLVTKYNCAADATCQTMAYRTMVPVNDNICNATYIYGNSCSCNYNTYTTDLSTNSPQANPGCASYNGRDVWFSTKVPSSGQLVISTQANHITDGGMAVYRGSSCTGTLTLLACNDNTIGNMPQISLTGVNPGDSLFIRFWAFNNAQSGAFGLCIRDPAPFYCMAGQASEINPGTCIQATPNKQAQIGCVWNTTQINMNSAFDYTYSVNMGINDGNGADGMTFVLQNSPSGTSACGNPGWQLGIGPITNTFIVEFDTFNNGAVVNDIAEDHIAISVNGAVNTPVAGPVQASSTSANIEDGINHSVRITWNPGTQLFSVYFDGVLRLTYTSDIINTVFGGNPLVYWGFTSSTGLFTNTQVLCPGNLPGVPAPVTWGWFDVFMVNEQAHLSWGTHSEESSKEFVVERSADGQKYIPIAVVEAQGNSSRTVHYQYVDTTPLPGISYYRLKQVDLNGTFVYSVIRSAGNGHGSSSAFSIYPNPASSSSDVYLELTEPARIEIYNHSNVLVHQQVCTEGRNSIQPQAGNISSGMYFGIIRFADRVYNTKIVFAD